MRSTASITISPTPPSMLMEPWSPCPAPPRRSLCTSPSLAGLPMPGALLNSQGFTECLESTRHPFLPRGPLSKYYTIIRIIQMHGPYKSCRATLLRPANSEGLDDCDRPSLLQWQRPARHICMNSAPPNCGDAERHSSKPCLEFRSIQLFKNSKCTFSF